MAGFLAQAATQPPLETLPVEVGRQAYRELAGALGLPPPPVAAVQDLEMPGPAGMLRLRCYKPVDAAGALPMLVYLHGGGWVIGDLETHDTLCRTLCHDARMLVVAVDYRLAPEHAFPAAPDDAEAAVRWIAAQAGQLGGDPSRIALAGDSAGGQLAVVAAQRLTGSVPLRALGLIYPAVTHYSEPSASRLENGQGKFLTADVMQWFMDAYLAKDASTYQHPEVSLLRSGKLHTLPQTWLCTLGHDPLRDEGVALARTLAAQGVAVTHRHEPAGVHCCLQFTAVSPAGARLLSDLGSWLRETV
jgi:acetyl esterase